MDKKIITLILSANFFYSKYKIFKNFLLTWARGNNYRN